MPKICQPTLENLGFDNRKSKRLRVEGKGGDIIDTEEKNKNSESIVQHRGTTTDSRELHPVTREEFLSKYAVEGLPHVYYCPGWIDFETAQKWRLELNNLLQWYRPKLKVYGREIQQSRGIAGKFQE